MRDAARAKHTEPPCVSFKAKHHGVLLPALMALMDDFTSPRVQVGP